mmetsp:Transcript_18302/g.28256  ORF Transcript_18302/g.28256 Transcript_18302/m.28256 type:complete len:197 (+) Transcript_18302:215-805(+)|eukprot:CAMPEP_0195298418 /NCGR_PEP_ID=MMETSP0707-20130614/23422_1 /TAXON_ID=33640 /ORGANISM="Asterionellopsis glacialis, Strain CCMP134" /LENGTH=196 /DNA_ID=CAMNT_0040360521 /DNA_START=130 /DNA_END=720 /DNA_ORIENTATION=+
MQEGNTPQTAVDVGSSDDELFVRETVLVGVLLCCLIIIGAISLVYQCRRLSTIIKNRRGKSTGVHRRSHRQQQHGRVATISTGMKQKNRDESTAPESLLRSARGKTQQELQQELAALQKVQIDVAHQLSELKNLLLMKQAQKQEISANVDDPSTTMEASGTRRTAPQTTKTDDSTANQSGKAPRNINPVLDEKKYR